MNNSNPECQAQVDKLMMRAALQEAERAASCGEVPVGAVVVFGGQVIARGHNLKEAGDPTAHAEIVALRQAAEHVGDWRLLECDLYVTLEPCLMCVGAAIQARIRRVVYGAADPKFGAMESVLTAHHYPWNHQLSVHGGVLAEDAARLLREFFAVKRQKNDNN